MRKNLITIGMMLITIPVVLAQEQVLFEGEFEAESYFTTFEGHWKIVKKGEVSFLILGEDFEAKKAPDLKIFFSTLEFNDVSAKNASSKQTSYMLAKLQKPKGSTTYEIPLDFDLSTYKSLVILCEKYKKLWGGSALRG